MEPAVFCRPVSTLRHARKGWLFQFFQKKRDCKDLLSDCTEKQAICGVVFFVARFWFCVVPFVSA
jgi:hypothetical protein